MLICRVPLPFGCRLLFREELRRRLPPINQCYFLVIAVNILYLRYAKQLCC